MSAIEHFYKGRLSVSDSGVDLSEYTASSAADNGPIFWPFTVEQIKISRHGTNPSSSMCSDGLTVQEFKSMDACIIVSLCNCMLLAGKVPDIPKQRRSILILKRTDDPLTICSEVYRLFSKMVAKRMLQLTPLNRAE